MSQDLQAFIDAAKAKKLTDEQIKERLLSAGWDKVMVESALDGLVVPLPPKTAHVSETESSTGTGTKPVTIVQNQSTRGLEYNIMFLSLLFTAFGFAGLLHDLVDNTTNTTAYPHIGGVFAITSIVVLGPIFTVLFLRLKAAEEKEMDLLKDPFRRKWIQSTLLVTFFIGVIHVVFFVYKLLSPSQSNYYSGYGNDTSGASENFALFLHVVVTLIVAGGIFAYYWIDEHKSAAKIKAERVEDETQKV